jgi:hypothetical protein
MVEHGQNFIFLHHIGLMDQSVTAVFFDYLGGLTCTFFVCKIIDEHISTSLPEPDSNSSAEPLARSRYQCFLALQYTMNRSGRHLIGGRIPRISEHVYILPMFVEIVLWVVIEVCSGLSTAENIVLDDYNFNIFKGTHTVFHESRINMCAN